MQRAARYGSERETASDDLLDVLPMTQEAFPADECVRDVLYHTSYFFMPPDEIRCSSCRETVLSLVEEAGGYAAVLLFTGDVTWRGLKGIEGLRQYNES
jgi:hypothetical protein